uniref:Ubiquitin carboxyl-terminal hydrolase MINDY n=1 Tax=Xiphophorus couchianus TaxID=32473 RepID=A0A3B5KY28_9TELE
IMVPSVEEISSSLVREYLSRKGLKRTIACMDEEHPRTPASINNRSLLKQMLNIEDLYRQNKKSPVKTLLEIIVKHHIERLHHENITTGDSQQVVPNTGAASDYRAGSPSMINETKADEITPVFNSYKLALFYSIEAIVFYLHDFLFYSSEVKEICSIPVTDLTMISKKDGPTSLNPNDFLIDNTDYQEGQQPMPSKKENYTRKEKESKCLIAGVTSKTKTSRIRRGMVAGPVAQELKTILLGSSLSCFSTEWKNQGFTFSDTHDLGYGIVQRKGGPCGVLASIQAFFLKKLLFENTDVYHCKRLRPSSSTRRHCLVLALAEVLWRAGEEKQAVVKKTRDKKIFLTIPSKCCCSLYISSFPDLQSFFLPLPSVHPSSMLVFFFPYLQELVNLLLCGRAVSNVFDNNIELDSGNGNMTLLKGIKDQCQVGLLSLFEHYNICKVGAYLKSPSYPIWVVCSESHFSVLFGLQRELLTNQDEDLEFDLYYYDGLANQQEEIRLTKHHQVDADLIPPLELCIRTQWKDASVNWNETEPIL